MSGLDGRVESGDFILENQIKILLSLLPPGISNENILNECWRIYHLLQTVSFITFNCRPKGRHSEGPREIHPICAQNYSRAGVGVAWVGVGCVMQGWGGSCRGSVLASWKASAGFCIYTPVVQQLCLLFFFVFFLFVFAGYLMQVC